MLLQIVLTSLKKNIGIFGRVARTQRYSKSIQETEVKDEPVKYSTSKASQWKAAYSTSGEDYYNTPRIQPLVVVLSLTAFMVYFCILREENDLDDWMRYIEKNTPLQLEEYQLRATIDQNRKMKLDTKHLEARLQEVLKLKSDVNTNS